MWHYYTVDYSRERKIMYAHNDVEEVLLVCPVLIEYFFDSNAIRSTNPWFYSWGDWDRNRRPEGWLEGEWVRSLYEKADKARERYLLHTHEILEI